jgi:glycine/D-amino acid oxidase-like deaminating enzyme/nitrite reductase/ring-hydroxylating ferredoxin subunit
MISRDGALTSLWQDDATPYSSPARPSRLRYDVAIVGGGITGVTTALMLQKAGKSCVLFEAETLCFGTTGGTTAHLNTLLDTRYSDIIKNFGKDNAVLIAQAAAEAIHAVKENIRELNIDCGFEEAEACVFARDDKQAHELEGIYKGCGDVGLSAYYSSTIPVPMPFTRAMSVSGQAALHPLRYVYALARAFEEAGGVIIQHCRIQKVIEGDVFVYIDSHKGQFQTSALIYATHIPPGVNLLHMRCTPYRSYALAVKLNDNAYPKELVYDMDYPFHYYRTQHMQGTPYLIAGGEDHKTAQHQNTRSCFRNLELHVRRYFNVAEVTHCWSSQYFDADDGIPYIGHLPGHASHVYVATGFGGNGITYSQVAARVLKSIILQIADPLIPLFSPTRIKPVAGFVQFVDHNADVVKQFVSKWFSSDHEEVNVADLAPGEARVVRYDGNLVGVSKDDKGDLHIVDPTCTHMRCSVVWNNAERSWECPCHGARYSPDGKVLTGPASKDLEIVRLRTLVTKS